MTIFKVQWGGDGDFHDLRASTPEEVEALLDQVAASRDADGFGYKVGVIVEGVRFGVLPFGLELVLGHPERTWLFYSGPEGTALAYDPDLPPWDGGPVMFNSGGVANPYDEELRLTPEAARRAVREFARTGCRPTCVRWDADEDEDDD